MNNHTIHGRLVRDPELTPRANSDSSDRVNFTVAVDRRYGDETDFIDCVAFGKLAEILHKWVHKGREINVWGEGQIHSYEDRNGVKRKAYSILVQGFDFCGTKSESKNVITTDSFKEAENDIPF